MLSILLTCAVAVRADTLPIVPLHVLLTCAVAVSADAVQCTMYMYPDTEIRRVLLRCCALLWPLHLTAIRANIVLYCIVVILVRYMEQL